MLAFWRIIKFAFQDMGRNIGMSFMTIFILILMLLSINMLMAVDRLTQESVSLVKDQINVSIYVVPDAKEDDVKKVRDYINSFPEVINVDLISKEKVLESFQTRHELSPEIAEALKELGENPFGPTIVVKTREPGDYKKIISALDVPEFDPMIEAKSFDGHEEAITRLQNITNRIERMGLGLSVIFAVISFLIIFHTIRVAIYTQRIEISIKRLVGASSWFIRGPYLVESVIYSFVSVAVTFALVFFALRWVDPYLGVVFPNGFSLTNYYKSSILFLVGIQLFAVIVLTVLTSMLAMRRQLKV